MPKLFESEVIMRYAIWAAFAVLIGANSVSAQQVPTDDEVIRRLITDHLEAARAQRTDRLATLYHPDAVMIQLDGQVVSGREAILRQYSRTRASSTAQPASRMRPPESVRVTFVEPSVAIGEVEFSLLDDSSAKAKSRGDYRVVITVWTNVEGRWAIANHRVAYR